MSTLGGLTEVGHPLLVTFPRGWELLIILLVVLLLFGARKLPELANSVGRSIKEFRKGAEGAFDEDDEGTSEPGTAKDDAPTPDRDAER